MIVVTGQSASGKSGFAEELAGQHSKGEKLYIATMRLYDKECEARVRKHQKMREDKHFVTVECFGLSLKEAYKEAYRGRTGLFECMSNYVTNVMFADENYEESKRLHDALWEEAIISQMIEELMKLDKMLGTMIVVTNEVFSDGMEYDKVTEQYLRILGKCNQRLAQRAEQVYEVVCGIPLLRKTDKEEQE